MSPVLPAGLGSTADLEFTCTGTSISARVPGRFRLDLPLGVTVSDTPEVLRYVRNKELLKVRGAGSDR